MELKIVIDLMSQQTQNICITYIQRRLNVFDADPTLYKCHTNVLCLLGYHHKSGYDLVNNLSLQLYVLLTLFNLM